MRAFHTMAAATILAVLTMGLAAAQTPVKLPTRLFVNDPPASVKTIGEAKSARAGDEVIVRGTIPAGPETFKANSAVFALIGDKDTDVALVRVVDKAGKPLATDIKGRRGLYPGAEIVVTGKRSAGDLFVIDAAAICVVKAALPEGLVTATAAPDAQWVEDARKSAKTGKTITLRGFIGGSVEPFVNGRAVFTIVGHGITSCADMGEDHCKTPWDYCCEPSAEIAAHSATIQVVDPTGQVLRTGVKVGAIKELAEVIVVGTVDVANAKTLVVNASSIHAVKKD